MTGDDTFSLASLCNCLWQSVWALPCLHTDGNDLAQCMCALGVGSMPGQQHVNYFTSLSQLHVQQYISCLLSLLA